MEDGMSDKRVTPPAPPLVECAVCKKLIPPSEAVSPEGHEYVLYFCGGKCHAEWEREVAEEAERAFQAHSGVKPH
jgi:hypothetical protein